MNEKEIQNLVLYRDGLIIVLDKPAGINCHQGPSGADYLEKYFNHLKFGLESAPHLAHRLDRDTSGCLILGRNKKALAKLGKLFSDNKVKKKYWAVCEGRPKQDSGKISAGLLKVNTKRGWRIVIDNEKGQPSITDYKLLGYDENTKLSWIECSPQTGRTHQIRIHMKFNGTPIVGDPFYNHFRKDDEIIKAGAEFAEAKLMLHAREVEIPLYPNKAEKLIVTAPPPKIMADFLERYKS
jgi:RluA family pseudouridine synthase